MLTRFASALSGAALVALVAVVLPGCSKEIGDPCSTALDCSASGTRICDMTQRGGYCTLDGCEENTCPDEAVCVSFGRRLGGQSVERLARTYCMYKCDSTSDCRTDDNYACFSSTTFGAKDEAQILGNPKEKFCAQRPSTFVLPDAGVSEPEPQDAAMSVPPEEEDAGAAEDDAGSAAAP